MKTLTAFTFVMLSFFSYADEFINNYEAGVYLNLGVSFHNPHGRYQNVAFLSPQSKDHFEAYVAKALQKTIENDWLETRRPLLRSIRAYCSDEYFKGKAPKKVTRASWLNCLVSFKSLLKETEEERLLDQLITETIQLALRKWKISPEEIKAQKIALDPLGLNKKSIDIFIIDNKTKNSNHILRYKLYKKTGYFIGEEYLEKYQTFDKTPIRLPTSSKP